MNKEGDVVENNKEEKEWVSAFRRLRRLVSSRYMRMTKDEGRTLPS